MERPFKDVSKKESTVYNIGANSNDYSESDSSDSENTAFRTEKIHVHSPYKMAKNRGGGLPWYY